MSIFGPSQTSIFKQVVTKSVRMTTLDLRASGKSADILFENNEALGIASGRLQCLSFRLGLDIQKYQNAALVEFFNELLRIDSTRKGRDGTNLKFFSDSLHESRDKLFLTGWATGATEIEISERDTSFIAHGIYNLFSTDLAALSVIGKAALKLDRELIISAYDQGHELSLEDRRLLGKRYIEYACDVNKAESSRMEDDLNRSTELAKGGDVEQQEHLGYVYFTGRGASKDISAALRWYKRAAEGGRVSSMRFLGQVYRDGLGVTQNYAEALSWYKIAAKAGDSEAQANVAWCKEYGRGCECDTFEAVAWHALSAKGGYVYSFVRLAAYFREGKVVDKHPELSYGLLLYARSIDSSIEGVESSIKYLEPSLGKDEKRAGEDFYDDIQLNGLWSVLVSTVPLEVTAMSAYYDLD